MQRISSHVLWLATAAIDLGAITPFFYTFRDREVILDLFEEYCGARLTLNCMRIGGLPVDLTPGWLEKVRAFTEPFEKCIDEYEDLLTENRIWKERTVGIAVLDEKRCIEWGVTGPVLRAAGQGVGRPPGAPVRVLPRARVRHPGREERRHLRPLPRPRRRDPPEPADRPAVPRLAREEPRDGDPRQGPARHQAAGRRGLRLRRGAEGGARLPPRRQRRQQAVPPPREAPELHQPPGPPRDGAGAPRRGPRGRHRDDRHRPRRSRPVGTRCPRRFLHNVLIPFIKGLVTVVARRPRGRRPDLDRAPAPRAAPDPQGAEPGRAAGLLPVDRRHRQARLQGGHRPVEGGEGPPPPRAAPPLHPGRRRPRPRPVGAGVHPLRRDDARSTRRPT